MTMIKRWLEKIKNFLAPKKQTTKRKTNVKRTTRNKVNSLINTNDLTDMQVWGVMCAIGFISALIIMWII